MPTMRPRFAYKFTGKERDPESGLDDFDARFYSSPFGRFITPDWEAKPTDVPYANFGNPQSLNLYSYVQNNPTTVGDPDGHCLEDACVVEGAFAAYALYQLTASPAGQQAIRSGINAILSTPGLIRNTFFSSDHSSDNNSKAIHPRHRECRQMNGQELGSLQIAVCRKYGQPCMIPDPETKLGFALGTVGKVPINGLRHPPKGDTNGWYIWCGEELSKAADFFSPLHTDHMKEKCPEALQFLGLPPGYRFLLAGD